MISDEFRKAPQVGETVMSETTKYKRVKVTVVIQRPGVPEEEVTFFEAEALDGFSEHDLTAQIHRPLQPVYDDLKYQLIGYKQTGPVSFTMKVQDRSFEGKMLP